MAALRARLSQRIVALMVLPLLLTALLPPGFMVLSSASADASVTFTVVFCSGQHTAPQQITLQGDSTASEDTATDGGCTFALIGTAALLHKTSAVPKTPAIVAQSQLNGYAAPAVSQLNRLRPRTRAPPSFPLV